MPPAPRTDSRILTALLLLTAALFTGLVAIGVWRLSDRSEAGLVANADGETGPAAPALGDSSDSSDSKTRAARSLSNEGAEEIAAAPSSPLEDDQTTRSGARNPLIRGVENALEAAPFAEDEKEGLLDSLVEADSILSEIKDENARAIRDVNRQVQLKVSYDRAPNIVIVLASHLGPRQIGCYGGAHRTEQLDQLAADGVRMTDFYAAGSDAGASLWSLMTGRDTSRARDGERLSFALPSNLTTLAETLWQAGYQTGFVGHWSLGQAGRLQGFDDWFGSGEGEDPFFPERVVSREATIRIPANANGQRQQFADRLYTQEALSFIQRRDRRRPFLLIVSYTGPGAAAQMGVGDITDEMVERFDRDIGRLREALREEKLEQHSAFVVTSGTAPQTPGGPWKGAAGELYEGGLRVPLLVAWPARLKAGAVVREPCGMWDLLPTCAALAQAQRKPKTDGVSMTADWLGRNKSPRNRMLYWETRDAGFAQAARMGNWKVVRPANQLTRDAVELYNLAEDPGERNDVSQQHPDILESFIKS